MFRARGAVSLQGARLRLRRLIVRARRIDKRFVMSCLNLAWTLFLLLIASALLLDEQLPVGPFFLHLVNLVLATLWFDAEYFLNYTPNGAKYRRRYLRRLALWKAEQRASLRKMSLSYAERLGGKRP